jgi:dihydropteroate synthase
MGVLNVTPDSFSDGGKFYDVKDAVRRALEIEEAGADILDIGGESTRPGHALVGVDEELARTIPVLRAIRADLPGIPLSIDTTKPAVAEAAIEAGADLLNDVWGVGPDPAMARLAAEHGMPLILMHNRTEARYDDLLAEVIADLSRAIERSVAAGCMLESLIVDPGFGFGKTPDQNLEILRRLAELHVLGRPIMLGTSRKSTLGRELGLPVEERLEATLATTALAAAAGIDLVRVHDVQANVRAARLADAVVRAGMP